MATKDFVGKVNEKSVFPGITFNWKLNGTELRIIVFEMSKKLQGTAYQNLFDMLTHAEKAKILNIKITVEERALKQLTEGKIPSIVAEQVTIIFKGTKIRLGQAYIKKIKKA